jgi:hypothetical protein
MAGRHRICTLPSEMVFAMFGSCSFCGKEADEIFGLAGVTHRNSRICNECIELCFDILAEEIGNTDFDAAAAAARSRLLDDLQHRVVSGERKDTVVDAAAALIAEMEEILKRQTMPTSQVERRQGRVRRQDRIREDKIGSGKRSCLFCVLQTMVAPLWPESRGYISLARSITS